MVTFLVKSPVHTMPGVLALLSHAATGVRAVIDGDRARCVAVIIEPAHPARIYPLLMSVYGLTARDQDVTRLICRAVPPFDIALAGPMP